MKTLTAFAVLMIAALVQTTAHAEDSLKEYFDYYKKHHKLPDSLMNETKQVRSSMLGGVANSYSNSGVHEDCTDPYFKLEKQQDLRLELAEFVMELMRFDIDPDYEMKGRYNNTFTMLVVAAMQCDSDMTALLIAAGANPAKKVAFDNTKQLGGMNLMVLGETTQKNWSAIDVAEHYSKLLEEASTLGDSCSAHMFRTKKTWWGLGKDKYTEGWEQVNPKKPYRDACKATLAFLKGDVEMSRKQTRYLYAVKGLINSGRESEEKTEKQDKSSTPVFVPRYRR